MIPSKEALRNVGFPAKRNVTSRTQAARQTGQKRLERRPKIPLKTGVARESRALLQHSCSYVSFRYDCPLVHGKAPL